MRSPNRVNPGRPVAACHAPVAGSRPLAHGVVTSLQIVALGPRVPGQVARSGTPWLRMEGNGVDSLTATVVPPMGANVIPLVSDIWSYNRIWSSTLPHPTAIRPGWDPSPVRGAP